MDICHNLLKISQSLQDPQKVRQLMLPRVQRLCVKVFPTVASIAEVAIKVEETLITHPLLNLNLFLLNHHSRRENAASLLSATTENVVVRLRILHPALIAASASIVSSLKAVKLATADVTDVAVMKPNTMTSLSMREKR